MFRNKPKPQTSSPLKHLSGDNSTRGTLPDLASRMHLHRRETPGYYPNFHTLNQQIYWDDATRKVVVDRVQTVPPIRFFTPVETLTLAHIVDRIIPQDDRRDETLIPILPFLDERLHLNRIEGYRYEDMPSDQDAYRLGIRALDAMANELHKQPFHELRTIEQDLILQSIHDANPAAANDLWDQMNIKRFWSMLVGDCCAVYYAHPYAWDEIGFGGPAYPRGYMRLEGGGAEPWEVNERRYEWVAPEDTLSDRPQKTGDEEASTQGKAGKH